MFYQIKSYIKFILKSTNQHGIHSPFVYNLVTQCFYNKHFFAEYKAIKNYKKALLKNKSTIKVTDLGAGSKVMKQQNRSITTLAAKAGTTIKRAKLLFRITNYLKPKHILELGTSLGIATQAMHLGYPKAKITSVEGCPNISEFARKQLEIQNINTITLITGHLNAELSKLKSNDYDLIFFDGNHQKEATLHYFKTALETAKNETVFIFDDIYWSKGMTQAWETIKQHPKVTVTIDTFFWGFVFFRKEQAKQDFIVRS